MLITVETPIANTPRVQQVRGMFDLPTDSVSRLAWDVSLPLDEKPWRIGLIVGPSGCGKSTIAGRIFRETPIDFAEHLARGSVVDAFPDAMPMQDIVALLSAVGFASPPAWLRPFRVLSTGQQFRVTLALLLAWTPAKQRIVFDEYTSVVDRTVAQIGSAALAKVVRQRGQQFVAVTCHEDVAYFRFSARILKQGRDGLRLLRRGEFHSFLEAKAMSAEEKLKMRYPHARCERFREKSRGQTVTDEFAIVLPELKDGNSIPEVNEAIGRGQTPEQAWENALAYVEAK